MFGLAFSPRTVEKKREGEGGRGGSKTRGGRDRERVWGSEGETEEGSERHKERGRRTERGKLEKLAECKNCCDSAIVFLTCIYFDLKYQGK